ncbi:MAG TPA: PAS domain-containing sensor histidine kinase [Alphaproteobacteria bacterium]
MASRGGVSASDGDTIFRTIFDHVAVGIWQSTPEGRYLRVNPRCAEIMGYDTPADAVAAVSDIAQQIYVDPLERERLKAELASKGRVSGFVARHRRRDGSVYWVRLSAVAVTGADGRPAFYIGSSEDISELIEIQEQRRATERDHREIWENAAEGIYRSSPEGRQLRANPALVRFNGYASEAELLAAVGDIAREWYVEPGRRDEFKRLMREHGRVYNFESEVYRHKTRERVWISENAWAVRDAKGKLLHYEGTVREITARKRAEQRMRESEERFRDFAESASDWYWETDADHRMSFISDNIKRFGFDPADLVGRARWEFGAAPDLEFWRRHRETLARREPFRDFIYRSKPRDGSSQVFCISGKPVFDAEGRFAGYRGSGRMITEQVEQQEKLRESEERFRDFAEASSDWYWETDANHVCTYISDAIRLVRGDPAAIVGVRRHDLPLAPGEDLGRWRDHLASMERHEPFRDFAYKIPGPNGEIHSIAVSGKPVFGPDRAFRGYRGTGRLITDQVRQQDMLRASEERFRDYADTASDWFWESDREHRFTYLSSSARRPNVRDQIVIGRRRWDYADDVADEPEKWAEHRAALARHEPFRDFVFRMRNAKGEAEYISASGKPVFDAAGEFQGYRGSARRTTEQMRQQALLRESEERFRDFAETASDWYWETDAEHRFSFISDSVSMLRGGSRQHAIGRTRWEMAADTKTEPEKWSALQAQLQRREPFRDFKYRIRVAGGEVHHVAVSGKPKFAPDGTFLGYRGSSRVITDQVKQREALLESEARIRDFAATASDWFWETDAEHHFTYFSSSARIGPGNPVEGLGKRRWELGLDVESDPDKWSAHRAVLERHEPFRDFVYLIRMANGEIHFTATSGMPIFGPDGAFRGYRGSSRLVTDAMRQEERLKEAKSQAEAASATKSTFLANMSHELRTPLNAIIGFSEIMNREMFGKIGVPRYADYIKDIGDSAQHLLRLIEDILDLSKAEAGKMELEEAEVDLPASIHSACLMLGERARRGGVTLDEDVAPDLPRLFGDRRRIRQVLLNLVSNAVKFTSAGGSVRVAAAANAEGGLVLTVADTGIGIEAADIPRVFEPFVQLGRDKGVSGEGTGLGLPLCKELVELHGGTISLASQPGVGTTVTAAFPPERTVAKRAAA